MRYFVSRDSVQRIQALLLCAALVGSSLQAQSPAVAGDTLAKMRKEALENSQAEAMFDMLTVNIGPRLTASPAHKRAAEYMRDRMIAFGLENVHMEPWQFGRGWENTKLTVEMIEPRFLPLIGYADGWAQSTPSEIVATPVFLNGKKPEEVAAMGDKLKGAIVMSQPMMENFIRKDRPQPSDPNYVPQSASYATNSTVRPIAAGASFLPAAPALTPAQAMAKALKDVGAAVHLKPSAGEHGTVFVTGRDEGAGAVPAITLSGEHYNMIARMLLAGVPVKLQVNSQNKFYDNDGGNAYNVIGEITGSDPAVRDEVVMIGGHLDSWHTGVGATDNADGSTTVVEALRIIKASGLKPRRTIRVALWGGEEQGLLGSRAWVRDHLTGDANKAAREKMDVYLNIDNGTGPIYGWFLQNNELAKPLFDKWLEPLKANGARKNVIENVGSTDHLSFLAVGVPGFNPIQDYTNYDIRTHHTNEDTQERFDPKDLRQSSLMMAAWAFNAAMADQKIPRPPQQ
jgi:hypothetical protein